MRKTPATVVVETPRGSAYGEIQNCVDVDLGASGLGSDEVELVVVAVDEHDPGALAGLFVGTSRFSRTQRDLHVNGRHPRDAVRPAADRQNLTRPDPLPRGQPDAESVSLTIPEYEVLAKVYDRWTATNDYESWCDHIQRRVPPSASLLDLCCGTGTMTRLLQQRGFTVAGVDGSAAMLGRARTVLAPGTLLWQQDLSVSSPAPQTFDALVCCFDSVNYFIEDTDIDALFRFAAGALRPEGVFVFDVNTERKLAAVFGNSHYGDDLGQFAYIWRNRYDADRHRVEFLISLYLECDGLFERHEIRHVQRWFTHDMLRASAMAHGFHVVEVSEDYSERPVVADTLRETWVLARR